MSIQIAVAAALTATFLPSRAPAASFAENDTIAVQDTVRSVVGLRVTIRATASVAQSGQQLTLSQTNDTPFLTATSGPNPAPSVTMTLTGTPDFNQAGTYAIQWTAVDDSTSPNTTTKTTSLFIDNLRPPTGSAAFYTELPRGVPIGNATGVLVFVVWSGTTAESDSSWGGYRVRRTIAGVSRQPMEVVGQWLEGIPTSPICFRETAPCDLPNFVFTGTGIFFRGFRNNQLPGGRFVIDYPPGAPVDACDSCWVYADLAALAGFPIQYAVTSIGPFDRTDYVETPLSMSPVLTVTPSTSPAPNLERVAVVPNPYRGSAEWDPAPGEGRIHFIHLPAGSTVRIFTTSAELIRELTLDSSSSAGGQTGDLAWDMRNGRGNKVVSGIYVYQVETPEGRTRRGHFVIIK